MTVKLLTLRAHRADKTAAENSRRENKRRDNRRS